MMYMRNNITPVCVRCEFDTPYPNPIANVDSDAIVKLRYIKLMDLPDWTLYTGRSFQIIYAIFLTFHKNLFFSVKKYGYSHYNTLHLSYPLQTTEINIGRGVKHR